MHPVNFYDPRTNTGPIFDYLKLKFNTDGCTHKNDMPKKSQAWFDRPARAGYEWKCLNGKWPEEVLLPEPTADEIAKQKKEEWKADRQKKVDAIVVEIDGMKFDGDELSQGRMARASALAETPTEKVRWILADNTVADVTADQLKRAARAAGREQEKLWIPQPEHNPPPDDGSDP